MSSRLLPATLLVIVSSALMSLPADAASEFDARVALHVKGAPAKGISICGDHKPVIPCSDYIVRSDLEEVKYVYLVVAQADLQGVNGLSCGVDYDPGSGQGVDVLQWVLCADGLEFPNSGVNGAWPEAGGGNRMTFNTCQDTQIGSDGVHAVVGAFITYAYDPDTFSITENRNLNTGPEFLYSTCSVGLRDFHTEPPAVAFSAGASDPGHNPCLDGPPGCATYVELATYGTVAVGDFEDKVLTITNIFQSDHITGEVTLGCNGFEIVSGGGVYDLAPGESKDITVRFAPMSSGEYECRVDTGTPCRPISLVGEAVGGGCTIPSMVAFPATLLGSSSNRSFSITNDGDSGGPSLTGTLTEDCSDFEILSGGTYDLAPGESQTVEIRFTPTSEGVQECQLEADSPCGPVLLQGWGIAPGSGGGEARMALHRTPAGSPEACGAGVAGIPCSEFVTSAPTNSSSFVYLVLGNVDPFVGVEGAFAGIDYDPTPGEGVDVIDWLSYADDQIPTVGPNGPWPAAGGGIGLYWNECPTTVIDPNGLHAVMGAFYIYTYGPDEMKTGGGGPFGEFGYFTCASSRVDLDPYLDAGSVVFSDGAAAMGINPCMGTVEAADAVVSPGTLNLVSNGKWITGYVELPAGYDPASVLTESVRLNDAVPADLSFPGFDPANPTDFNENGIPDLTFKFDRGDFIGLIPEDEDFMDVVITGMGDAFRFVAFDRIRLVRPHVLSPNGGESLIAGSVQEITWQIPSGWQDVYAHVDFSTDEGASWTSITDQGHDGSHLWKTPLESHASVELRVRVYDQYGFLGVDVSDAPFSLTQTVGIGDGTRLRPGLRQGMPNPFRASTTIGFTLERDAPTTLNIFTVQGQRVRVLEDGHLPAGTYERAWDGRDDAGNRVASGVYLVHLKSGELQETRRVLLAR